MFDILTPSSLITKLNSLDLGVLAKMRDPFPPARIAAINALAATQQFYTIAETSTRILPALCHALVDPELPVRKQAFKVIIQTWFSAVSRR